MGPAVGRLEDRVALVTGSASGIGAACALRFAREGAILAGFDLRRAAEGDWAEAARTAPEALHFEGDVRREDDLAAAVEALRRRFGRIDVLVNSAGVAGGGPVHAIELEEWRRVIDVNLGGTFLACRRVLPLMLERGRGSIVNVASVEGLEGFEGGSAYNASKGAVLLLTRNMAIDYARRGIRVNAVCPGFVETPMSRALLEEPALAETRDRIREAHQLGRFGRAEEIAQAVLFLASDEASFVTGHPLVVDGGYSAGHRFGIARLMGLE